MAFPTAVNHQITDAISQTNLKVLGDAPAMGLGNLYIATSQALSNAAHNATTNQQQATTTLQAATTKGLSNLYAVDPASTGVASATTDTGAANATANGILGLDRLGIPGLDLPTPGLITLCRCCA